MRRARSTRAEIVRREEMQAQIVAELVLDGAEQVAEQIVKCWRNRLFGDPRQHRPRCRSVACLSCRRPPLTAWWRASTRWSASQGATSYFVLPADAFSDDLPVTAKALRNLRDRLTREESWLFADLAFLGTSDGQRLHVLVSHPSLSRQQVTARLRALRSDIVLVDVPASLAFELSPQMLARLGTARRGLKPMRFTVWPRRDYATHDCPG